MAFVNPYAEWVAGHDPLALFRRTAEELPALVAGWRSAEWSATYTPGKRSGGRILLHLLHVEMIDGVRLRMALSTPGYSVQPFEPDAWMESDPVDDGPRALAAWSALRALDLALWRTVGDWDLGFAHPECGEMTLRDLAGVWNGHDRHHLEQLRAIGRASGR